MGQMLVYDAFNAPQDYVGPDGQVRAKGLQKPRMAQPFITANFSLPLIPVADIPARLAQQDVDQSSLIQIRNKGNFGNRIPSRDQNGKGYCWAHSGVSAMLLQRARDNEPYADLSAYAVACIIKNYRDEGGWGDLGLKFLEERGVPTSQFWAQQSMSRSNDNAATWADAGKHKANRWEVLDNSNRDRLKQQMATCLIQNIPLVCDYNRWSHSVCGIKLKSWNPFSHLILNSWSDDWSDNGVGELAGDSWLPDDCWALITASGSEN